MRFRDGAPSLSSSSVEPKPLHWLDRLFMLTGAGGHAFEFLLLPAGFLLIVFVGSFLIELLRDAVSPGTPLWNLHKEITAVLSCLFAMLMMHFALRRMRSLFVQVQAEKEERRLAEQELQVERDRLMGILETMEDGIYIVNSGHDVEYTNPALVKEFGEVEGRKCFEYFHERTEPCPWCRNSDVFAGQTVRWMWTSPRNGKTYDLFDTPFRKPDGSVSKLEIFRDITDLVRAQDAVRESEQRYRMLFDEARDAAFLISLTPEGEFEKFIEVNKAACEKLGYTHEELLRLSPYDINPPEDHEAISQTLIRFFTEDNFLFERTWVRKDGKRIPVEFNAHLFFHKGRPTLLSVARDISERKLAEETLRESERKYRELSTEFDALLKAIPDPLVLLSPDLRILWANREGGCEPDGAGAGNVGIHCHDLVHNKSICGSCPVRRCFETGREESCMVFHQGRYLNMRAFPVLEGVNVSRVLVVMCDMTEKMVLQTEAMQARHLASLGELAASVAHEVNNPANGIINYAQLLVNRNPEGTEVRELGNRILKESERIASIVKSLLSFARQEGNGKSLIRIRDVLSESLALTQAQLRKDSIGLKLEIPEDLPEIFAGFQQIQQVILNLVSNSRYALNQKFPEKNEEKLMEISAEVIKTGDGRCVRLTFLDHGTGIPAGDLGSVTEPFFSTKPSTKGTGLGLSITRGIVENHGGRMTVESVEGSYTRVTVDFPAQRNPNVADSDSGRRGEHPVHAR